MRVIELDTTANQEFQVTIDGNRWVIALNEGGGIMAATITLNDVTILSGQRVVSGTPVIPYPYLQGSGNFWFLTENDELPYWELFSGQILVYMSAAEAAVLPKDPLQWPSIAPFKLDVLVINSLLISLGN